MTAPLTINVQYTEKAKKYLERINVVGPLTFACPAIANQPLLPGDKIRMSGIENCPWFVLNARYWTLGESATLTLWLDEPDD